MPIIPDKVAGLKKNNKKTQQKTHKTKKTPHTTKHSTFQILGNKTSVGPEVLWPSIYHL